MKQDKNEEQSARIDWLIDENQTMNDTIAECVHKGRETARQAREHSRRIREMLDVSRNRRKL